jgi:uncharacterized protein YdhG (YjbR/CyaY superfamily)
MPTTKSTKKSAAKKSRAKRAAARKSSGGFTADERAAMKEHARELKAQRAGADGEREVLEAIAKMPPSDRAMGKKIHEIVRDSAPDLSPKTWYGMPAYANKYGKVVLFFRGAHKFKERYAMLGFNDSAKLDDGAMWPIAFALPKLTAADEKKLATLVKKAVKE